MGDGHIIRNNPLRILGVYSDTPKKEIVANLGKMRAFAKTGKALSFDSDFTSLLGPVNRTLETIEKANNDISLPKDKLQAGMFWFMQHTDNDKAAMECLKNGGDPNEALTIIQRKGNYSGIINMAVLSLILKRWDLALYSYAYLLESEVRRGALIKAFTDTEDFFSEDDLVEFISSKLIHDFPGAHWIDHLQHENVELGEKIYPFTSRFAESKFLSNLNNKCVSQIKKEIDSVLKKASSVTKKDANANLRMAGVVEDNCKYLLKELRLAFGKGNKVYVEYADKVANQVLNNCIDYYNYEADDSNTARNIIKYIRFAYRTAESKTAKERARKNLDILNEELGNVLPKSIEEEYNAIDKLINDYQSINAKMDYSDYLGATIDKAYSLLSSMKNKIVNETENKFFVAISSNFVRFAIKEIVIKTKKVSSYTSPQTKAVYKSTLLWGRELLDKLTKFIKDDACTKEYNNIFFSLLTQIKKIGALDSGNATQTTSKTTHTQPKKPQASSTSANSTTFSSVYTKKTTNKEEKTNDSSLPYIFGGVGITFIVIMLIISLSTNHRKDDVGTKAPETVYNSDYQQENEINEEKNAPQAEESYNTEPTTATSYKEEPETYSNYEKEPETFSTITYSTGDRPYLSTYGKGRYDYDTENSLLIRNGSSTDAVVFLERLNGKKIRHVYIRKGDRFNMTNIPGGQYIIKVMQGTDWNPDKDNGNGNPKGGFMYSCSISKSESYDPFDYPHPSSGRYSQGEVTLYKVQNGNMHTEAINENDLF